MNHVKRCALLACLLPLYTEEWRAYFYHHVTAGANETVTVQQPATGAREVTFVLFIVTSPSACVANLEIGGTAATTTAVTPVKLHTKADVARALIFAPSNAGAGTVIHPYPVAASSTAAVGKSGLGLGTTSGDHYNVRTTCPAATSITVVHSE